MSLINDALKRVQQAQAKGPVPPAGGPELQPTEAPPPINGPPLARPTVPPAAWIGMGVVVLLVAFLAWHWFSKGRAHPQVAARPKSSQATNALATASRPANLAAATSAIPARVATATSAVPAVVTAATSTVPAGVTSPAPVLHAEEPVAPAHTNRLAAASTTATNVVAATEPPASPPAANPTEPTPPVTEVPAPLPAVIRLQGVILHPTRPSALISGSTLFIGDKYGDMKLVAVDADSATLVGGGLTNILTLKH